jgi:hypothetical protein
MKISSLFAWFIPELRNLTGAQLLKVWGGCAPYSRNTIYLHFILLLGCCSVIFNLAMRLRGPFLLDILGLLLGLTVPANTYFYIVFKDRRAAIRQFIEQNQEEFRR